MKNIMQYKNIGLAIFAALTLHSCSTAYKSTQTPDDVYYSPARPSIEGNDEESVNNNNYSTLEDRSIMMGIQNRRWRYLNDPFGPSFGYNNFSNSFSYYNSPYNYCYNNWNNNYGYYYNPFYYPYPIYNPIIITKTTTPVVTTPRMVNLNAYSGYDKRNIPLKNNQTNNSRRYNNSNSRVGDIMRKVFTPSSSRSGDNNSRSYSPSSNSNSNRSSSSGSSRSSSGGGSISRPSRGK